MRPTLLSLAALIGLSAATVQAATVRTDFTDADFVSVCSDGTFNEACEVAVAEIRAGNAAAGGTQELNIRQPDPSNAGGFGGSDAQLAIPSGNPLGLSISYIKTAQTFGMSLGGTSPTSLTGVDFSTVTTLLIRNSSRGGGALTLSDLVLNGQPIGGTAVDGLSYIVVGGFDFDQDFTLSGDAAFTFGPGDKLGSNLAAQFKFVDIKISEVPVPASALLLLAGVSGLALMQRRLDQLPPAVSAKAASSAGAKRCS